MKLRVENGQWGARCTLQVEWERCQGRICAPFGVFGMVSGPFLPLFESHVLNLTVALPRCFGDLLKHISIARDIIKFSINTLACILST